MAREQTERMDFLKIIPGELFGHIQWNEALMRIDAFTHPNALAQQDAPPTTPVANGSVYIVGSSPSGAWVGHANELAAWFGFRRTAADAYELSEGTGGRWIFLVPYVGKDCLLDGAPDAWKRWNGSSWVAW
jgi:hypothetical protein